MNSKKNISQIVYWGLTAPPVAVRSPQAASIFSFVVHRIWGLTAPPVAVRRPQAASDSTAAVRQQTQIDDIASSDPRLVKKIVARGSLFVARKKSPGRGIRRGRPSGRPARILCTAGIYDKRPMVVHFMVSRTVANYDRPPANCDLSSILVILSVVEYNKVETSKFPFFEVSESSDSKNRFF